LSRRRRSLVLLGLALVLGSLAASDVAGREAALRRSLGPVVPVVVARSPLPAGEAIDPRRLTVREVPGRFAPRGAFTVPAQVAGQRPSAAVPAGADVTSASLAEPAGAAGAPVRRGERVADVVASASPELVVAGARVDVLVTREARPGAPGGTHLALQDVEVLSAAPAPAAADAPGPQVAAALRVSLRQAVYLAAAQSFARELRLLPRASADRRRAPGGVAVDPRLG
jgi:pilus assembly protein CpaB